MLLNKEYFPSLKVRWLHLSWQLVFFSIIYYANLFYAKNQDVVPSIITDWDKQLPYIDWMILPYFSSVVLFLVAFLRRQSRASLLKLSQQISLSTLCSGLIFFLIPLSYGEMTQADAGFWAPLYHLLYQVDLPYNQLPSLHVIYAIIFLIRLWPQSNRAKILLLMICGLLISSTVLTQQHHLIDIVGGVLLAAIILFITHHRIFNPFAFFYFSLAGLMGLLSVIYSTYFFWFVYWSIHFSFLTYVYIGGHARVKVLGKKANGQFSLWQRWLLFPYFLSYWFLWYLKKPAHSKAWISVDSQLFIGRHLTMSERQSLPYHCRCIDLGAELKGEEGQWLEYKSIPLLDLAPIEYQFVLPICHQLQWWQSQYPHDSIYIHCTMGISRSLAVLLCYACFKKENIVPLINQINNQKPEAHLPDYYLSQKTLDSFYYRQE